MDARGRLGFEERDYPQARYLQGALQAAQAVSARELVAQGLFGAELGKALAEQRLQALKRYKQAFSLPTAPPA